MSADPLADAVGRRLAAWPRQRITLSELVDVVVSCRPELNASVDLGPRLAEVVHSLVADGVVRPTHRQTIFRGIRLPVSMTRPVTARPIRERPALRHPWRADLTWAAETQGVTFEQLLELDRWMTANPDAPPAPLKERSLEIWGDEKLLDRLRRGPLRGHAARRPADSHRAPAPRRRADLRRHGRSHRRERHHLVIAGQRRAGAGRTGRRHLDRLDRLRRGQPGGGRDPRPRHPDPASLWYFGDLDARGLEFAAEAAAVAISEGLPVVRPHPWLYETLLDLGRPQPRRQPWAWKQSGLDWLGPDLGRRVVSELPTTWPAQEWVSTRVLRTADGWLLP